MVVLRDESLVTPERRRYARTCWWVGWLFIAYAALGIVFLVHHFDKVRNVDFLRTTVRMPPVQALTGTVPPDRASLAWHLWIDLGEKAVSVFFDAVIGILLITGAKMHECRPRQTRGLQENGFLFLPLLLLLAVMGFGMIKDLFLPTVHIDGLFWEYHSRVFLLLLFLMVIVVMLDMFRVEQKRQPPHPPSPSP